MQFDATRLRQRAFHIRACRCHVALVAIEDGQLNPDLRESLQPKRFASQIVGLQVLLQTSSDPQVGNRLAARLQDRRFRTGSALFRDLHRGTVSDQHIHQLLAIELGNVGVEFAGKVSGWQRWIASDVAQVFPFLLQVSALHLSA